MKEPTDVPSRRSSRKLKVEATGDFADGKIKPQIRLKGLWLADAGFKPGDHVEVSILEAGLLKLAAHENGGGPVAEAEGGAP